MHAGRAAWTVQRYRRVRTRALCLPSRHGGHGARVRPGAGRKTCLSGGRPRGRNPRRRRGRHRSRKPAPGANERNCRCRRVARLTLPRCSRCHEGGAGLSPCARNTTIREAISRDTSSSQHAACTGHAARRNRTRSAAGTFSGHRQRSRRICHQKCGCRLSPTTSGSSRSTRDRAA